MDTLRGFLVFCSALAIFSGLGSGSVAQLELHDCMPASQMLGRALSLDIRPFPIRIPGNVTVSGSVQLFRPLEGNIRVEVEVKRKLSILGYIFRVPCVGYFGSCNYTDVCSMIGSLKGRTETTPATLLSPVSKGLATAMLSPANTDRAVSVNARDAVTEEPERSSKRYTHYISSANPQPTILEGNDDGHIPVFPTEASNSSQTMPSNDSTADLYTESEASSIPTNSNCPKILVENNIPCACPFNAGVYTLNPTELQIPDLGNFNSLAQGDYQAYVTLYDDDTGEKLVCQSAKFSLIGDSTTLAPCHGLECLIG